MSSSCDDQSVVAFHTMILSGQVRPISLGPRRESKGENEANSPIPRLRKKSPCLVLLQPDPFLNELTSMFERSTEKGSVWVTLKRSSLKSKVQRNKQKTDGEAIEYRCLIRATDGKKTISTSVGAKDHMRFQASYATILKAHMTALKKRERKDKKKAAETDRKDGAGAKKPKNA
ncbi:Signal recognition particle 14 kDa protein [Morus notabilis]|uniref:Signal recognition particle 14 kDa protein n=1 Tax=Morus notabilis TaxID=981085 RepID=W9S9K7_9ROSA|nr:Signal recognition particle 14 kDa protein [Morus notabilis]